MRMKLDFNIPNHDPERMSTELLLLHLFMKTRGYYIDDDEGVIPKGKAECSWCGKLVDAKISHDPGKHAYECYVQQVDSRVEFLMKELKNENEKAAGKIKS